MTSPHPIDRGFPDRDHRARPPRVGQIATHHRRSPTDRPKLPMNANRIPRRGRMSLLPIVGRGIKPNETAATLSEKVIPIGHESSSLVIVGRPASRSALKAPRVATPTSTNVSCVLNEGTRWTASPAFLRHRTPNGTSAANSRKVNQANRPRGNPWSHRIVPTIIGRSRRIHPKNQTNDAGDRLLTRPPV